MFFWGGGGCAGGERPRQPRLSFYALLVLYTATVAAKAWQSTPNQAPRYYGVFVFNLDSIINMQK